MALCNYKQALSARSKASPKHSSNLVELDTWFREELPPILATRRTAAEDRSAYLTRTELGRIMEYKLAVSVALASRQISRQCADPLPFEIIRQRGKFRPRLVQLALSNEDALVQSTTKKVSSILLESTVNGTVFNGSKSTGSIMLEDERAERALQALCALKGVGPATASLLLSLLSDPLTYPDSSSSESRDGLREIVHDGTDITLPQEPFMSDEVYELVMPGHKADYTLKSWREWRKAMRTRMEAYGGAWASAAEFERACYANAWWDGQPAVQSSENESTLASLSKKRKGDSTAQSAVQGDSIPNRSSTNKRAKR